MMMSGLEYRIGYSMYRITCALGALFVVAFAGCSHGQYVWVKDLPPQADAKTIQPGDTLAVLVKNQPQLSGDFVVRPNGKYAQPLVGEIEVQNHTPEDAAERVAKILEGGIVTHPVVTISVATPRTLRVSVLGEVRQQGAVQAPYGEGVLAAIARAGGLTEFADGDSIFVLRERPKRIRVRFTFKDLTQGEEKAASFKLQDNDIVVVE